jgi:hypothetical protein
MPGACAQSAANITSEAIPRTLADCCFKPKARPSLLPQILGHFCDLTPGGWATGKKISDRQAIAGKQTPPI